MKNYALIYSSVTGNTRAVAEALKAVMPENTALLPIHKAPEPAAFDFLVLGFWVRKAAPDPRMLRYMEKVNGKDVAWFGTLAAWPDSPHAQEVRRNADAMLVGNRILGDFLCQGRLEAKRFAASMNGKGHPLTEERKQRLLEAAKHPNDADFAAAQGWLRDILRKEALA